MHARALGAALAVVLLGMARKNNTSTKTLTLAERIAQIEAQRDADLARLDRIQAASLERDWRVTTLMGW